ncbi:MAG TPA: thioredoxin domain-containing protein [Polyangiaceae bacterium]|nr:thioredoxin domain-containing protein [Polyangiaceae bacterium]
MLTSSARRARATSWAFACAVLLHAAFGCHPPYANSQPAPGPTNTTALASSAPAPAPSAVAEWGEADAPVELVEYGDLECPFTGRAAPVVAQIQEVYGPQRVHLVWRHFPLPFHAAAPKAHEAAEAVRTLGGNSAFFRFTALALAHRETLDDDSFATWAEQSGVPRARFTSAMQQGVGRAALERDLQLGKAQGVTGTPEFFVNGVLISGAQPFEAFRDAIDRELGETQKLLASGVPRAELAARRTQQNFKKPEPKPERESSDEDGTVWMVPVAPSDPVRGPSDALVTVVLWSDYQCPFCKRVEPTLAELRALYKDDVRIVWKDNPLPFHPRALPAALLARTAYATRGNDVFWQVHDALFDAQEDLSDEALGEIARKFAVRFAPEDKSALRQRIRAEVDESASLAADLKANGTPHFFVNGVRLVGAQPLEKFRELIDAELAKARALKSSGVASKDVYAEVMKGATPPPPPQTKEVPAPDATTPVRGNARARVTMQVFSDFQCPFCRRVNPTLAELEREFGKDLRIAFRHEPLPFHEHAELAAEAAQEAFAQKGSAGFFAYHDRLFAAQDDAGGLERENLESIAKEVGLDLTRFRAALDSHRHADKVRADLEIASKAKISGTPGFVINGYFLSGAQPAAAFRRLIRRALGEATRQTPSQPSRTK